jgi:hypothetical protein
MLTQHTAMLLTPETHPRLQLALHWGQMRQHATGLLSVRFIQKDVARLVRTQSRGLPAVQHATLDSMTTTRSRILHVSCAEQGSTQHQGLLRVQNASAGRPTSISTHPHRVLPARPVHTVSQGSQHVQTALVAKRMQIQMPPHHAWTVCQVSMQQQHPSIAPTASLASTTTGHRASRARLVPSATTRQRAQPRASSAWLARATTMTVLPHHVLSVA